MYTLLPSFPGDKMGWGGWEALPPPAGGPGLHHPAQPQPPSCPAGAPCPGPPPHDGMAKGTQKEPAGEAPGGREGQGAWAGPLGRQCSSSMARGGGRILGPHSTPGLALFAPVLDLWELSPRPPSRLSPWNRSWGELHETPHVWLSKWLEAMTT